MEVSNYAIIITYSKHWYCVLDNVVSKIVAIKHSINVYQIFFSCFYCHVISHVIRVKAFFIIFRMKSHISDCTIAFVFKVSAGKRIRFFLLYYTTLLLPLWQLAGKNSHCYSDQKFIYRIFSGKENQVFLLYYTTLLLSEASFMAVKNFSRKSCHYYSGQVYI